MMQVYCTPCRGHGLEPTIFKQATMPQLIDAACEFLKVDKEKILGRRRMRNITEYRHMIMAYLSNARNYRLTEIGVAFNRDHSSVIHAKVHVSNLCATDELYSQTYASLTKYLDFQLP